MRKKVTGILTIIILILALCVSHVQAASITKEQVQKSLENYAFTGKIATAVIGTSKYTVGGDAGRVTGVSITDDVLSFIYSDVAVVYKYKVEGNVWTFIAESDINSGTDTNSYLQQISKPRTLNVCFLAVTDSLGIDSNSALYYYQQKADRTTAGINYSGIDNQDYLGIAKKYVSSVGKINDPVFNLTTKVVTNNSDTCKYETILEINMNQVSSIPVNNSTTVSQSTNPAETAMNNKPVENYLVPVNTTETTTNNVNTSIGDTNTVPSNDVTTNVVSSNEISDEQIAEATNQIDKNQGATGTGPVETKPNVLGTIFKWIAILAIIGLIVYAFIQFRKKSREIKM